MSPSRTFPLDVGHGDAAWPQVQRHRDHGARWSRRGARQRDGASAAETAARPLRDSSCARRHARGARAPPRRAGADRARRAQALLGRPVQRHRDLARVLPGAGDAMERGADRAAVPHRRSSERVAVHLPAGTVGGGRAAAARRDRAADHRLLGPRLGRARRRHDCARRERRLACVPRGSCRGRVRAALHAAGGGVPDRRATWRSPSSRAGRRRSS